MHLILKLMQEKAWFDITKQTVITTFNKHVNVDHAIIT
jgi:hypothetical protein